MTDSPPETPDDVSLNFCIRCGVEVAAYRWNESCGEADYGDNYSHYFGAVKTDQPLENTTYDCPKCQKRWQAPGLGDTGYALPCGHFMPGYTAFCATCGQSRAKRS